MSMTLYAYVWRDGVVEFGEEIPEGSMFLYVASPRRRRKKIEALCQLADDGVTLLVPGVAEAESNEAAKQVLLAFQARVIDAPDGSGGDAFEAVSATAATDINNQGDEA
jgi:hypothetical protein